MARPFKSGIDYYPVDVDMDEDDKLIDIFIELGTDRGMGIVLILLNSIYKNGYYIKWNDSIQRKLCLKKRLSSETIKQAITILTGSDRSYEELKESPSFFDKNLFKNEKILTSNGIQKRFFLAVERRKVIEVDKRFILLNYNYGPVKIGSKKNKAGDYEPIMADSNYFELDKKTIPFQFVIHGLIEDRESQENNAISVDTNEVNVNTNSVNVDINKLNEEEIVNVCNNSVNVDISTQRKGEEIETKRDREEIEKESTILQPTAKKPKTLYKIIELIFLDNNNNNFDNYKKEGQSIKRLITKAEKRENPETFIQELIEKFYDLTINGNDYWTGQPFLPSILNSDAIFPRVEKQIVNEKESEVDYADFEMYEGGSIF